MDQTGQKELLFNARGAKHTPPIVRPLEEQTDIESQNLWLKTCIAIKNVDHNAATDEKTKIEEAQREKAAKRHEDGKEWHPKLFRAIQGGPGGSEEGEENLDWIINANMLVTPVLFYCPKLIVATVEMGKLPKKKSNRFWQSHLFCRVKLQRCLRHH